MESTRIWLARAIETDLAELRAGLGAWFGADASLHGDGGLAAAALGSLIGWLRQASGDALDRRAASLTRSCVLEYLKQEGRLDRLSRRRRAEAVGLLDDFLAGCDSAKTRESVAPHVRRTGVGQDDSGLGHRAPTGVEE